MEYGGQGLALAGIILSSLMMFFVVPIIAAIAIPNLLAARRAANEGSAISTLRTIAAAEARYAVQQPTRQCGELADLQSVNYIDSVVASGQKNGYKFSIVKNGDGSCEMHAVPDSKSSGTRSFFVSSYEGVIRGADKFGLKAGPSDPDVRSN
jgi:type II secretory pathway pseudopilin PulG